MGLLVLYERSVGPVWYTFQALARHKLSRLSAVGRPSSFKLVFFYPSVAGGR